MKEKNKAKLNKSSGKKSIPTYYLSFNSGEKKNQQKTNE